MAEAFKICPICETANHRNAVICNTCGTSLANVETVTRSPRKSAAKIDYDFRYGETDLLETSLSKPAHTYLVFAVALLVAFIAGGAVFAATMGFGDPVPSTPLEDDSTPTRPALNVATVTIGPPTATPTFTPLPTSTPTITPTPSPCIQRIVAGGSLIAAIINCGHTSRDVMPTVMALNNITDANSVQVGQEIIIPWPTETPDPNAPEPEEAPPDEPDAPVDSGMNGENGNGNAANDDAATGANGTSDDGEEQFVLLDIDESIDPFAPTATPTLPAGVMWHRVQGGENIIAIAVNYNADAKVLSELNPEIDFARCEFGQRFGGPECVVQLSEGQMMRVPAPTPTPTLSPTPDPNATATPTPTATFNRPSIVRPSDRAVFSADQIITLRWIPSATLLTGEAYRVDVENLTTGEVYMALTLDIAFPVPADWQQRGSGRYEYRWSVSVVDQMRPDDLKVSTEPKTFVWQGRGETD